MRNLAGSGSAFAIATVVLALASLSPAQNTAPATPAATVQPPPATNVIPPPAPSASLPAVQKTGDIKEADPNDPDQDPVATIKTQVREVNVIFTVTDKHGRFKRDLKQEDLQILDDGKAPEQIRDFRAETDLPLRVGLLVDASNSIRDRFKFEQEAATEFLNSIPPGSRDSRAT